MKKRGIEGKPDNMKKSDEQFPYEDILDLPHHVSKTRKQMPRKDRAAQFSPFAALSGFEEAVRETARVTENEIYLDEDSKTELDRKLRLLTETQMTMTEVAITYFEPDRKKTGGAYKNVRGYIKKIDQIQRQIHMTDGRTIEMDAVLDLESQAFIFETE